jgi:pantothenate kinase
MKSPQHLAKAVLLMVTNNIGSIAMLHAQAAGVRHVMFTGSFLHENKVIMTA